MANRRVDQSDSGRCRTKQHRARRLIDRTLAGWVLLGVSSSCSAPAESIEQAAKVGQNVTGADATVVQGATGVVDFIYTSTYTVYGSPVTVTLSCTGSMIAPHVVLTAARCFLPFSAVDPHEGDIKTNVTIHYYDPKFGRRKVHDGPAHWKAHPSFPGYDCQGPCCDLNCIGGSFFDAIKAKKDPKHGRRRVHPGPPHWVRHPRFPGDIVVPLVADEADTAKNDLAVLIVPEQLGSLNDRPTDYHDYLRIYSDQSNHLNNGEQKAYGAGLTDPSGHSDDQLRYGAFNAVIKSDDGEDLLKLEGRQGDNSLLMCRGDHGGPFEYNVTVEGQSVPTIAGVWSGYNLASDLVEAESNYCANNDKSHDDSYACLINDDRVRWIEGAAGLACADQTGGNLEYKRCFDLPFIEDVPGEGLYEPNVATAIVMAAIW